MNFIQRVVINPKITMEKGKVYPFIEMANVSTSYRDPISIDQKQFDSGVKFQDGDTVIARITPCLQNGKRFYCHGIGTGFGSTEYLVFRPKDDTVDNLYLYYFMQTDFIKQSMINSMTGATGRQRVNNDVFNDIEISFPEISTQRKIGEVLSSYDSLIENNQKQIKLLEEAAQRLYKEWFVDLRFPGYETTPVVDGVPEGWGCVPLGDIISYEIGGGWGEETPTGKCDKEGFVIRGTDFYGITHGDFNVPFRYHSSSNLSSRVLVDGDIIFEVSGGSKTEGVARSAYITQKMIDRWKKPVMCASFCKLIRPKDSSVSLFLYNHLQYLRSCGKTTEYDKRSASSIVNYRWKDFLLQENILIPSEEVLMAYNALAKALQDSIVNCSLEIEKATVLRDCLLPKLMSEELEV